MAWKGPGDPRDSSPVRSSPFLPSWPRGHSSPWPGLEGPGFPADIGDSSHGLSRGLGWLRALPASQDGPKGAGRASQEDPGAAPPCPSAWPGAAAAQRPRSARAAKPARPGSCPGMAVPEQPRGPAPKGTAQNQPRMLLTIHSSLLLLPSLLFPLSVLFPSPSGLQGDSSGAVLSPGQGKGRENTAQSAGNSPPAPEGCRIRIWALHRRDLARLCTRGERREAIPASPERHTTLPGELHTHRTGQIPTDSTSTTFNTDTTDPGSTQGHGELLGCSAAFLGKR